MTFVKIILSLVSVVLMSACVQYIVTSGKGLEFSVNEALWNHCGDWFTWKFTVLVLCWSWLSLIIPVGSIVKKENNGDSASYRENGVLYYWLTLIIFFSLQAVYPDTSNVMFESMPKFTGTLNTTCLVLSAVLLVQGRRESRLKDEVRSNPLLYEYVIGVNKSQRLFGADVKQVIVSRSGMMLWQILICAFYMAGVEKHGFNTPTLINMLLQSVYIAKFYWWECGYFTSTARSDNEKCGYLTSWYTMVLVPTFYTYTTYYLTEQIPRLSLTISILLGVLGVTAIFLNFVVDYEKQVFRKSPNLDCMIWGKKPSYILAEYEDESGNIKKSALLTSGFWGVGRRLNYTFELISAFCWCMCGYGHCSRTLLYFIYLTVRMIYLTVRGERKCRRKYGVYWDNYCQQVPYVYIPLVY